MMRFPMLCVVALLGAAVSVPAQVSLDLRFGRHPGAVLRVGHRHREPVCHPPRPVCPPPRQVCPPPAPRGHWQTVCEQVLIPGYWDEQHVPPTYGWVVDHCGRRHWGIVDPGGCRRVWVEARYETRERRVWVPC